MYVLEESDCAVLPMKLPNKEAKASAEAAEGRARTKENDVQHHTYPTQSGIRVSQGLGGVRRTAQARKQERFTALLHHLIGRRRVVADKGRHSARRRKYSSYTKDNQHWYRAGAAQGTADVDLGVEAGSLREESSVGW